MGETLSMRTVGMIYNWSQMKPAITLINSGFISFDTPLSLPILKQCKHADLKAVLFANGRLMCMEIQRGFRNSRMD